MEIIVNIILKNLLPHLLSKSLKVRIYRKIILQFVDLKLVLLR